MYLESFTLVTTHNKTEFMQYRFGTHLKIVLDANDVHGKSQNRFWLNKDSKRDVFRDTVLNICNSYEHCSPETSRMNQFVFGIARYFDFHLN